MKLKIEKTVVEEIEVEYPYFTSNRVHYFMFAEDGTCLQVSEYAQSVQVHQKDAFPMSWMLHEKISEEDFREEHQKMVETFNKYYNIIFK